MIVNINEAKANMSKLMALLESGQEKEIIICRRGTPVVRWVSAANSLANPRRFGVLKGKYPETDPQSFFDLDEEIAKDFEGK